jgi:protein SMG6
MVSSISILETKILNEDPDDLVDEGRVVLQGRGHEVSDEDLQQQKSSTIIINHGKQHTHPRNKDIK